MKTPQARFALAANIIGWVALIVAIVFLCLSLPWAWIWAWYIILAVCFGYLLYFAFSQNCNSYGYMMSSLVIIFGIILLCFCWIP